uniref:Helicase ATP-binding domain-containing protein n=2 Tax=Physcomitrium patens TaxID=3218 RepID=A0A7I4CS84_PHYPA|nr:uncharacterized protein LOC112277499 isoform X3 [Physcomitrium patens]|eukprot:XP_024365688.1 uncharacterized protein LOC112277499 isoform X3 [Physcomitrella patens]
MKTNTPHQIDFALHSGLYMAENALQEAAEKALVDLVKVRQMEVERLERELDALRAHYSYLFKSFSVPTFPCGHEVSEPFEIAIEIYDYPNGNDASKSGNNSLPYSSEPDSARITKQLESPSSTHEYVATIADEANKKKEVVLICPARHLIPTQILSSSTSGSSSKGVRNVMDWAYGDDTDLLEDGVRREKLGVQSPRKSAPNPTEISTKTVEKKPNTDRSSNDNYDLSNEESPSDEDAATGSEESSSEFNDIKAGSTRYIKPADSDSEEVSSPSSSSASESLTKQELSPLTIKKVMSEEIARITWQPKSKAPSSSSEESEESSSSSDDCTSKNRRHAHIERASLGRAREPNVSKAASTLCLSSDASPEDHFDWMALGLQGPWLPLASDDKSLGASTVKDQLPLPLKFPSIASYVSMFQKLVGEEVKAVLLSDWERFKAEQDSSSQALTESQDSRAQSSRWQMRSMVQTMGDPFHYFEAQWMEGPNVNFDVGEFLCITLPETKEVKAVAIVHYQGRNQAPLLRTRVPWGSSLGKCVLLRLCNMVSLRRMYLAVSTISDIFSPMQQQILDPLANIKFLRPQTTLGDTVDGDTRIELSFEFLRTFNDRKRLNTSQLLSISCLLHMRQGFQLVQGPPGTGKTSTIIGMVSSLLIEEPSVRILVCAPSNAALDEVAARLVNRMLDKSGDFYSPVDGAIVRFGSKRVIHPLVHSISLDTLCARIPSSSHRSKSWVDLLDGASVVCATLSGCGNTTFDELENKFDVIIVDEAAQAVEAEVVIALKRVRGRCVMVGDPRQLPATVFQRPSAAYGRSLFERFEEGGVPVLVLNTQYRMHPSICLYPSRQFYGGALKDSVRVSSMQSIFTDEVCVGGIIIRGCRFKLGHYCFMDVGWGTEREELVGHSRANFEEALVVCNVVESVVKGLISGLKPNVGVITPYIAQRGVIEGQLARRGIDSTACEVNTVDGFQGREKDVIVLSCVRAMADRGLGFVSDERRMNVALTRAKYSLIVVGHAETLQKWSPTWGSLIDDAQQRGCYQVLTNKRNQDTSSRNWRQNHPQKDFCGSMEIDIKCQHSRKRGSNCTEERLQKKMGYTKPIAS